MPVPVRPDAVTLLCGDARAVLDTLPAQSVHTCITSPSYFGLRDYGCAGQIGLEATPQEYVAALVDVFRGVWRVLRPDGLLWLVLGDSYAAGGLGAAPSRKSTLQRHGANGRSPYLDALGAGETRRRPAGIPAKSLLGIPWRVAFALQDDGWILRQECIWAKPNPMPESVKDRCTRAHETVFMLAKGPRYYYDADAIREPNSARCQKPAQWIRHGRAKTAPERGNADSDHDAGVNMARYNGLGRNARTIWTIPTSPLSSKKYGVDVEHYAAFPPELVRPMVRAATSERGVCPQCGAPWRRVVERTAITRPRPDSDARERDRGGRSDGFTKMPNGVAGVSSQTTGWEAGCSCEAGDAVPATVLDCFCGSGTAGVVAVPEGRRFVGIDLNPQYVDLARRRIATAQPPLPVALALAL